MPKFEVHLHFHEDEEHEHHRHHHAVSLRFVDFNFPLGGRLKIKGDEMSLIVTDTQKCSLSIQPTDVKGNPAAIDGVPVWSVSDATILSVTPAADGLSAVIVANGPVGTSQVNVQADADLGAGTTTITGTLDVQVTASEATALGITAGTPEPQ